jgi:cytochrome c heme-lyase
MAEDKCPVDHSTREAWAKKTNVVAEPVAPVSITKSECPVDHSTRSSWLSKVSISPQNVPEAIEVGCTSDSLDKEPVAVSTDVNLPTEREISSIPRTSANSNWVYPSQKQFYDAMRRKKWDPLASDMNTVVPIHNIVNERAWQHIMNWEKAYREDAIKQCGGISLTSFKGDLKKLTPRAWFKSTILGEEKPFDRHDWIISRCGVEVEYVIDFYGSAADSTVFLDVRPKLNSWEGIKLRLGRALGWQ